MIQNEMGAPYGLVQNATTNPDDGYIHQDMVYTVARDHAATVKLTATITRLTTQLATINEKLIFFLQEKRASRGICRVRNKAAHG